MSGAVALIRRILVAAQADLGVGPAVEQAAAIARAHGASMRLAEGGYQGCPAAAREFGADLLILSPPRDPLSRQLSLGPADWEILRYSPCPVLLTRAGPARPYREILVAVDPMHSHDKPAALDDALIEGARALADVAGARIGLLHCYLPPEYVPFRAPGAASSAVFHGRESSLDAHRAALHELAQRHGIAEEALSLEPGDARAAIPEAALRTGADLVVLGTVARSRIRRLLIGSTTEPVLPRLACDVLAVKLIPDPS